jgi:hypothetical protein
MPVPASGELKLRADIALEVDGSASGTNVSLGTLADTAGFDTPPDAMSEFYGYSACSAPTGVDLNYLQSATPTGFWMRGRYTGTNGGCDINSYGFYIGTDSSSATNNTKYERGTDAKGAYSNVDYTFTGGASSTTYYVWVYFTNIAGYTSYSSMGTIATLAPYISATQGSTSCAGDTSVWGCNGGSISWNWQVTYYDAWTGFTDGGSFVTTHSAPTSLAYTIGGSVGCPGTRTNSATSASMQSISLTTTCVLAASGGPTFNTTAVYSKSGYTSKSYTACAITCTD